MSTSEVVNEVSAFDAPLHLLLLADPDEVRVRAYLGSCRAFVIGAEPAVGVMLLRGPEDSTCEIVNIAVDPSRVRIGIGAKLVGHAVVQARAAGASRLVVGTGETSHGPLAFYQKLGFRMTGRIHGFFDSYVPPVIENGVLCRDMLRLELAL